LCRELLSRTRRDVSSTRNGRRASDSPGRDGRAAVSDRSGILAIKENRNAGRLAVGLADADRLIETANRARIGQGVGDATGPNGMSDGLTESIVT
jgi:hypothetical protein